MKIVLLNKYYVPYKILSVDVTNEWNNYTYGPLKLNHYSNLFIEVVPQSLIYDTLESDILFYINSPRAFKEYFKVTFTKFKLADILFIRTKNSMLNNFEILKDELSGNI